MAKNRTGGSKYSFWLIVQKVLQIQENRRDLPSSASKALQNTPLGQSRMTTPCRSYCPLIV